MGDEVKAQIKKVIKIAVKAVLLPIIIVSLIIVLIFILLAAFVYFITIDDGTYKEDDWTSPGFAAEVYSTGVVVSDEGMLSLGTSAQEVWDKLVSNNSRVTEYLDSPQELSKLMNAEIVTQYPDTRQKDKLNEEIDWKSLEERGQLQGIIKFKRAFADGSEDYITYVTEEQFQRYIDEYNQTGTETAKKNILSHFTIQKSNYVSVQETNQADTDEADFVKYDLTERQLKGLAYICKCEQGTPEGAAAEASLMANRFEIYGSTFGKGASGLCNYVSNSGWFAYGQSRYNNPEEVDQDILNAVREVLVNGNRTLPSKIDEHDMFGDIVSISTGNDIYNRDNYISGETIIKNKYGATYTFHSFPTETSDPFGYTGQTAGTGGESLNMQTGYTIKVATIDKVTTKVDAEETQYSREPVTTYTLRTQEIAYSELINKYTLPFDLLWAFLVVGEDKGFALELADLAYNSDIVITIYDNCKITTDTELWDYLKVTNTEVDGTITELNSGISEAVKVPVPLNEDNYKATKTVITETNTLHYDVTKADVWYAYFEKEYKKVKGESISTSGEIEPLRETNFSERPDAESNSYQDSEIDRVTNSVKEKAIEEGIDKPNIEKNINVRYYYRYKDISRKINTIIEENNYVLHQEKAPIEKIDETTAPNFVTIYNDNDYYINKRNINSASSWLFEIIESNENPNGSIANMLDLVKYLLHKATGQDYGVTEFDFSAFEPFTFNSTSILAGSDILWEYLKSWEGYGAKNSDGTKYKIVDVKGNRTVGYGVDLETSGKETLFKQAGYSTNLGDYVDIEFVDNISKDIINKYKEDVMTQVSACNPPLNEKQIHALTAIKYQYGNLGNFVTMYNKYGNTQQLRTSVVINGLNCFINGQVESNGRADANWKLFSQGIYQTISGEILDPNKYISSGGSASTQNGDGYSQIFISSTGRKFKEYKQYEGSYAGNPTGWGGTIASEGCMVTTIAILATGYDNDITPANSNWINRTIGGMSVYRSMMLCLPNGTKTSGVMEHYIDKTTLQKHLLNGGTAYYFARGGKFAPGSTHFMAILDINKNGSQIYLSNPGRADSDSCSGWMDLNSLYNSGASEVKFFLIY